MSAPELHAAARLRGGPQPGAARRPTPLPVGLSTMRTACIDPDSQVRDSISCLFGPSSARTRRRLLSGTFASRSCASPSTQRTRKEICSRNHYDAGACCASTQSALRRRLLDGLTHKRPGTPLRSRHYRVRWTALMPGAHRLHLVGQLERNIARLRDNTSHGADRRKSPRGKGRRCSRASRSAVSAAIA